jgi:hypothetical protein
MADIGLSHVPNFRDRTARAFLSETGTKSLAKPNGSLEKRGEYMRVVVARK